MCSVLRAVAGSCAGSWTEVGMELTTARVRLVRPERRVGSPAGIPAWTGCGWSFVEGEDVEM